MPLLLATAAFAQSRVTTPKEQFGFNIGDDYQLANYTQLTDYWRKLDAESDRMKIVEIGKTAEGRTMQMAIVTSPENHRNLDRFKQISRRLALGEGLSDDEARKLSTEGRAVVWIDGGLHATETLGAQQLIETVYQLVSRNDDEAQRFLKDVIVLATLVNPDGMELVSNWYMRESDPTKRSLAGLPRLYQKYIGHDNNRDFYMSAQPETEAINRIFYHEWFPQIVYNHHQTGPPGTVLFAPPFRDPFNYLFDPIVVSGIDLVGAAMHQRFVQENKPGATTREGTGYSTWWNGGLRTTVYFHNMIGLLTETIGSPTPMEIPFVPSRQLPSSDLIAPIAPQKWHFRQSVEYSLTANWAVIDVASKHREDFLFNTYRMAKNSIERGNRDHWTPYPRRIAEVEAAIAKERAQSQGAGSRNQGQGPRAEAGDQPDGPPAGGINRGAPLKFYEQLREAKLRDSRGFIIPSDQADFLTATKFVNALIKTGVTVHRATKDFEIAGKRYPANSFVIKSAQAFRPHVLDMFEPQDHPNDFAYPGGPPIPPYDSAGWTLAFQMGVTFDRILDGFDGPFEKVDGFAKPLTSTGAGTVSSSATSVPANATGYLISHEINDSFVLVNRLLKNNDEVYWLKSPVTVNGKTFKAGAVYVPAKASARTIVEGVKRELGLPVEPTTSRPTVEALKLRPVRIGLWDRYGGSMPSGWTRWLLEQFDFPFTVVYPQTLDAGNLESQFDVLIFVTGAVPPPRSALAGTGGGGRGGGGGGGGGGTTPTNVPAEYRGWLGSVTADRTIPQLRKFAEAGGTIITIGSSTNLGYHFGLPYASALVERAADGSERSLSRDKYYIPGSVLQVNVDTTQPLAFGMSERVDVFFDNSPVFRLKPDAMVGGLRPVAWFSSDAPLRSGWAWGQKYLQDGIAVIDAPIGKGRLLMFGPEITFRAQPHGTFKFLFNGIYYPRAETVNFK